MEYLNLGCGYRFISSSEWLNVDLVPANSEVVKCNFLKGIPLETGRFDLVYHSHVLEHFTKEDGKVFIQECFRVCKPGGRIRIALPNLELIAQEYLKHLTLALSGDQMAQDNYDWILLEMYDQTVRKSSGGEMLNYLSASNLLNKNYIEGRIGLLDRSLSNGTKGSENHRKPRFERALTKHSIEHAVSRFVDIFRYLLLGKSGFNYYTTGRFRAGGEIHQWMYDRFSLSRLLMETGFVEVKTFSALTSGIASWADYGLDDPNESASLFIEGRKP